jgi:hypothetical protein
MLIGNRTLKLRENDGTREIEISMFAPKKAEDGAWSCRYEIDWPDGRRAKEAWGADSVQAIVLALNIIGSEIYTSDYHKAGQLMFDSQGRGYGFPVPVTLRDLLEGDDKAFF